jgi:hypothetical protein
MLRLIANREFLFGRADAFQSGIAGACTGRQKILPAHCEHLGERTSLDSCSTFASCQERRPAKRPDRKMEFPTFATPFRICRSLSARKSNAIVTMRRSGRDRLACEAKATGIRVRVETRPVLALSGHRCLHRTCLLLGVKQT